MAVKIRKTTLKDIYALADNVRETDKREIMLASGHTPLEALKIGFERSYFIRTILFQGKVIGIFGATRHCILTDNASVWLIGAKDFFKIKKDLLIYSKPYIKRMLKPVEKLENDVWIENKASVRWLKWCGFHFDEAQPFGITKALFQHFYLRKEK